MSAIKGKCAGRRGPSRSSVLKGSLKVTQWGQVPDAVLEDTSLSPAARLVVAWVVGRPANWTITIDGPRGVKASLGLTRSQWSRVSAELRGAGLYAPVLISGGREQAGWNLQFDHLRYYS